MEISENTIHQIAQHIINKRAKQPSFIPITTISSQTPYYYEIISFNEIDNSEITFYAIDGIYVGFTYGKKLVLNDLNDPVILGKEYCPTNILIANDEHKSAVFDELLQLKPVKKLFEECFEEKDYYELIEAGK